MKPAIITISIILAYILGGFLTYGYTAVRKDFATAEASMAGVFWPFYWFGRGVMGVAEGSENLFKEAPPMKVEK